MKAFFLKKHQALIIGLLLLVPAIALAAGSSDFGPPSGNADFGHPSGSSDCGGSGNFFTLCNPLSVGSFCGLLLKLLDAIISFGVPIAFLFLVYSGFLFITARGNDEKLTHAKRNFFYVIVGIGLFLGAWTFGQIVAATIRDLGGPDTSQQCK